ncbi:hypothetical protein BLNAU_19655 [Blattamonas nauphoetae]|uniref:BAR domain-containing protein n=1 Tax=Blattamonas nauphoetae TaxID=2049346 RepID=A0ABQ9X1H2_9EUKA|nr:hypothetical protein BLNAU_19655 [Blattamonas nauphoetae]
MTDSREAILTRMENQAKQLQMVKKHVDEFANTFRQQASKIHPLTEVLDTYSESESGPLKNVVQTTSRVYSEMGQVNESLVLAYQESMKPLLSYSNRIKDTETAFDKQKKASLDFTKKEQAFQSAFSADPNADKTKRAQEQQIQSLQSKKLATDIARMKVTTFEKDRFLDLQRVVTELTNAQMQLFCHGIETCTAIQKQLEEIDEVEQLESIQGLLMGLYT